MEFPFAETYTVSIMAGKIENLLEQANSSIEGDTSVNFAKRNFAGEDEARSFFSAVKSRLLDLANWSENSSPSEYALFDEHGTEITGEQIDVGKFIRITVRGSGKYDWVRVTNIHETPNEFVITVKPSYDPTADPVDPTVISHFFGIEAINNFCIQLDGKTLALYVIGIGEKQNTANTGGALETARNVATANLGYYLGLQKAMWTEFCNNFLNGQDS